MTGHISLLPPPPEATGDTADATLRAACERHTPAAKAIARDEVETSDRVDVVRAATNLRAAQAVIESHRDEIVGTGVAVSWTDVVSGRDLADALLYADAHVVAPAKSGLRDDISALTPLAGVMTSDATTQVRKGVFSADEVRKILRSRRSDRARAKAVLQLAAMYDALSPEDRASSALTAEEQSSAVSSAQSLLPRFTRDRGATHPALAPRTPQRDLRDRIWTLVVRHHQLLGRLAGAVWGIDAAKKIPRLRSTAGRPRRPRAATPDVPPSGDPEG